MGTRDLLRSHDGILHNGTTFTTGEVELAFQMDGANDYVSTNLDVQPSAMPSTTWDAWVYPTRVNYGQRQQILSDDNGDFDRSVGIEANTANFMVFVGNTDDGTWYPTQVTLNQWQHIAVVYTPSNVFFYKDGVQYSYGAAPTGQATGYRLQIGWNPGFGEYFQGRIDEVDVFNRALSAAEIQAIYTADSVGKCRQFMHIASIDPFYQPSGNGYRVGAIFTLQDANGAPVPAANATVQVTLPGARTLTAHTNSNANGLFWLAATTTITGTYTFTVLDLRKAGWLYDPALNVETSDSVTIP